MSIPSGRIGSVGASLAAAALAMTSLATSASATTTTISVNPSQIGSTVAQFDSGPSCPMIDGFDAWHFVAPGTSVFTGLTVTFTGATAARTVLQTDPKHAYVYTRHGLSASLASGSAVIDGTGSQFVLSHTCTGIDGDPVATTTATVASTVPANPTTSDTVTVTDVATVSAGAGWQDPTGNVTFEYCYSATTPVTTCATGTGTTVGSPVALVGGDSATDGIATATLTGFQPTAAGYYLMHASYVGDGTFAASSDNGVNEAFTIEADNTFVLRYGDIPRLIDTAGSSRRCAGTSLGGKTIGTVRVGDIAVPVKSTSYPRGGVFAPARSAKIAGVSTRHQPLNATSGTTFIGWHARYGVGCMGTLNVLLSKAVGDTFITTDNAAHATTWRIVERVLVSKGQYQRRWFTLNGPRQLVLATCAGYKNGKFRKNIIIVATPVTAPM